MGTDQEATMPIAGTVADEITEEEQRAVLVLRHILETPGANMMFAVNLIDGQDGGLFCALACVEEAIEFIKTTIPLDQPPTIDSVIQCFFYLCILSTAINEDVEGVPTDEMGRRWAQVYVSRCTTKINDTLEGAFSTA